MPDTYRQIDGELKILQREGEFIFPVELWLLNDQLTHNGWRFVNLAEHREKWAGVPILTAYVNGGNTIGSGHNQETKRDRNGEEYQSFTASTAERIVGALSDDPEDIRIEERDGAQWVVGKGFLWAWYAHELVLQIASDAEQGRAMSVSIEALVSEAYMDGDVEVETTYTPLGVTVLGHGVAPAVDDAHIAMLSAIGSELNELKLRAASYIKSAENPQNNPQNNPNTKGVNKRMRLSKQQVKDLQAKFSGYTVLAAEQNDNGVVVCLMSDSGRTAVYKMESLEDTVYAEKIQPVNAQVHFCAEESEEDVCVDACDMVDAMSAECAAATSRAECAEKNLAAANETIKKMEAAESARRLAAAKTTATATLNAFNANREDKVSEDAIKELSAEIESGKFTACEDENHVWVGDKTVEEKVLSICAVAVMEMDKAKVKNAKEINIWEKLASGEADDGSIDGFLARKGIKA